MFYSSQLTSLTVIEASTRQKRVAHPKSVDISQSLDLHPLTCPNPQIQAIPAPPIPDLSLATTSDRILHRLLDITRLVLDDKSIPPTGFAPPLQHVSVTILRRAHQHLVVEDHLGALEAVPELQHGHVTLGGSEACHFGFVGI